MFFFFFLLFFVERVCQSPPLLLGCFAFPLVFLLFVFFLHTETQQTQQTQQQTTTTTLPYRLFRPDFQSKVWKFLDIFFSQHSKKRQTLPQYIFVLKYSYLFFHEFFSTLEKNQRVFLGVCQINSQLLYFFFSLFFFFLLSHKSFFFLFFSQCKSYFS